MTSNTLKVTMTTVVYAMCLAAFAADITLSKTSDYNVGFNDTACWSVSGVPGSGDDYWLLDESKIFYSKAGNKGSELFSGNSLNIGSPSSSSFGFKNG
jgi:hypothetical protein